MDRAIQPQELENALDYVRAKEVEHIDLVQFFDITTLWRHTTGITDEDCTCSMSVLFCMEGHSVQVMSALE
mgnify:CR=1 FL=1